MFQEVETGYSALVAREGVEPSSGAYDAPVLPLNDLAMVETRKPV